MGSGNEPGDGSSGEPPESEDSEGSNVSSGESESIRGF